MIKLSKRPQFDCLNDVVNLFPQILISTSRTAAVRQRKAAIWARVVHDFNEATGKAMQWRQLDAIMKREIAKMRN